MFIQFLQPLISNPIMILLNSIILSGSLSHVDAYHRIPDKELK